MSINFSRFISASIALSFALVTGLTVTGLTLTLAPDDAAAERKLKLGFIGSLTGPAAAYGTAARNGLTLALEELPESQRPEVVFEDDQFQSMKTVTAFQKLHSRGVDLVITIGSNPSKAVAPLAKKMKIPMIAWASDQTVARGNELVIRSYPSGAAEGAKAAEETKRRSFSRIAAVSSTNDYASSWVLGLKPALGANLVSADEISPEVTDFRTVIGRALTKRPEHFVICLNPGQTGLFAKQLRQLKPGMSLSGCEYLSDSSEVANSDGALIGSWYAAIGVDDAFVKRYQQRFGNTDVISAAANHYDLIRALAKLPDDLHGAAIISALIALPSQHGAAGEFAIRNVDGDRFFDVPLTIREVSRPVS